MTTSQLFFNAGASSALSAGSSGGFGTNSNNNNTNHTNNIMSSSTSSNGNNNNNTNTYHNIFGANLLNNIMAQCNQLSIMSAAAAAASAVQQHHPHYQQQQQQQLYNYNYNYNQLHHHHLAVSANVATDTSATGLLEVLPLHFKCVSSSSGTTMDKTTMSLPTSLYVFPNTTPPLSTGAPPPPQAILPIDTSIFGSIFSLQPLQHLLVERMEPVSRHFAILDFGYPVSLTDLVIPACGELASISIDVWLLKEQKDSRRLCLSTDIGTCALTLNDLQPPAICRYVKLVLVAHTTNISKGKIPIGYFFGYPLVFITGATPLATTAAATAFDAQSSSSSSSTTNTNTNANSNEETTLNSGELASAAAATAAAAAAAAADDTARRRTLASYQNYLSKLVEDNQCQYAMHVGKLRSLLNEITFAGDNVGHLKMMQLSQEESGELAVRIREAYDDALDYQLQLNLNAQLIARIERLQKAATTNTTSSTNQQQQWTILSDQELRQHVANMPLDQLRIVTSLLVKTLIALTFQMPPSLTRLVILNHISSHF